MIHETHTVVQVWGDPDEGMPPDGRWCDDRERYADVIYHREPQLIKGGEWFCARCGTTTFPDERIGTA